ncbi:hypothetical protein ADL07_30245 [Streptomyces sp. NRRL F-4707]|nr:hypothetical protein ADL07_30245 [Streptomyces sp. NRRL F-4707]
MVLLPCAEDGCGKAHRARRRTSDEAGRRCGAVRRGAVRWEGTAQLVRERDVGAEDRRQPWAVQPVVVTRT